MSTPIKMPQLGESVVDGTVARWLKAPGESVEKLEPLLEVSTDKIDTEIPAPIGGVLLEITVAEGETVDAGTVIGYIGDAGEALPSPSLPPSSLPQKGKGASEDKSDPSAPALFSSIAVKPTSSTEGTRPTGRDFISPVVGRMAAEHGVDLALVSGTGLNGRVTKQDLVAHLDGTGDAVIASVEPGAVESAQPRLDAVGVSALPAQPAQPAEQMQSASSPLSLNDGGLNDGGLAVERSTELTNTADETLHPLTTMRRAIAQHMVQSKATSPHVTTVFEVDMTRVVQHREAHKGAFRERGVALNYTAYFVAATAAALRDEPMVNSRFTDDGIVAQRRIHIGIATAVADGLLVPVLRDADELNLQGVARGVEGLAARARSGRLTADELQGGTFTISNHGVGGSLIGTPIINQPQAGILGVGAIAKRPVVVGSGSLLPSADDGIVIRPMCYLSFTFDHRILDGAGADRFVSGIKTRLECWGIS